MTPGSSVVGVLGGAGTVGRAVAVRLAERGHTVRVGGRDEDRAVAAARSLGAPAHGLAVDLADPGALATFCAGCAVVVNAAGPASAVGGTVATAALEAQAHQVDVAGDPSALSGSHDAAVRAGLAVVHGAGATPGLTGLLARLVSRGRHQRRLDVYAGGAEPTTTMAAQDVLDTAAGRAGALWCDGATQLGRLAPGRGLTLPGFEVWAGATHVGPYLSDELVEVAEQAPDLDELRAWTVHPSLRLPTAIADARAGAPDGVAGVIRATALDVEEHGRHFAVLVTARARPGAGPGARALVVAPDSWALSGAVAASATEQCLQDAIAPGVGRAALVLDPVSVIERLRDDPVVTTLELPDPI